MLVGEPKGALWLSFADGARPKGWGVGSGEWGVGCKEITPHSPFPTPHSPYSQRQRHVLLVVSLSLIVKTRPALTTARPDLAWAIGLMLTRANILSARSVSRLPTRFVSPLPV